MIAHRSKVSAYNKATHTVSKTRQVVMLYDGVIRFLQQAREAMEQKKYQHRYELLVKASNIILGLQSCLDYGAGQEMAQTLYDFYSSIDNRILALHRSNDAEACLAIISELKEMRAIWSGIDDGGSSAQEPPMEAIPAPEQLAATALPAAPVNVTLSA